MTDMFNEEVNIGDEILYTQDRLQIAHFAKGKIVGFTKTMAKVDLGHYIKNVKVFYKLQDDFEITEKHIKIFHRLQ